MVEHVDIKPLKYYTVPTYAVPIDEEQYNTIVHLPIATNNFEIKTYLMGVIQHNQFQGLPIENTNLHLSIFLGFRGTFKANGVDQNIIQIILFPFSLRSSLSVVQSFQVEMLLQ